MSGKYYQLVADEKSDSAELYIFGDIAEEGSKWSELDKSASDIVSELKALKAKNLDVHINSYGGDVKEGLAIYNTLKNADMKVKTIDDGFACSAASVVFMAGGERVMNDASLLMIHNAWTFGAGNAEELRKMADDLEIVNQASVEAYKANSNLDEATIKELMDAESWILPEEALDYGFATSIKARESSDGPKQGAWDAIFKQLTATQDEEPEEPENPDEPGAPDEPEMPEDLADKLDEISTKLDILIDAVTSDEDEPEDPKESDEDEEDPEEPDDESEDDESDDDESDDDDDDTDEDDKPEESAARQKAGFNSLF